MNMVEIKEKIELIKSEATKLCGIADNISYNDCDDESADNIDRIESKIKKYCDEIEKILAEFDAEK